MTATRLDILGVPLDSSDLDGVLTTIRHRARTGAGATVFAVNPEKVIAARANPALRQALSEADVLIPDGIGVVAAAWLLFGQKMSRIPGAELMPLLCAMAAADGHSVYLLGAAPGVADRAAQRLTMELPDLKIAGLRHGYFEEAHTDAVLADIRSAKPTYVFVAFGSPRQELWAHRYKAALGPCIVQTVGGTFDVLSGAISRAPAFFRDNHLEWFFRLASNPARLARQKALPTFAGAVLAQAVKTRFVDRIRTAR